MAHPHQSRARRGGPAANAKLQGVRWRLARHAHGRERPRVRLRVRRLRVRLRRRSGVGRIKRRPGPLHPGGDCALLGRPPARYEWSPCFFSAGSGGRARASILLSPCSMPRGALIKNYRVVGKQWGRGGASWVVGACAQLPERHRRPRGPPPLPLNRSAFDSNPITMHAGRLLLEVCEQGMSPGSAVAAGHEPRRCGRRRGRRAFAGAQARRRGRRRLVPRQLPPRVLMNSGAPCLMKCRGKCATRGN